MALYRLDEEPAFTAPVLVAALEGLVDAGGAGTTAAGQLAEGGTVVATFDADAIYDYRVRRPTLDVLDGRPLTLEWPSLTLTATTVAERELLVLTGPEPDYRWRELATDVVELAKRLDVASWASLGAIPAAVAHTRPVPILATASADGLLPPGIYRGPNGLLRVPSAALSAFELTASSSGIPAIGLFAQVPHYVRAGYPTASIALLTVLGHHLGVDLPVGQLAARALEGRSMLDAATAGNEQTKAYIEQLEALYDEARLPEGEDLIADIERFLRGGGGSEGPGPGEGEGGPRIH